MNGYCLRLMALLLFLPMGGFILAAELPTEDSLYLDDAPLENSSRYPEWFELSFLNLRDDLSDALERDKRGLILYFGQEYCPYCKALLETDFGRQDIERYTRRYFDVVPVDIHGLKLVRDLQGRSLSEKAYAAQERINFTPTLIFYDAKAQEALRLQGYYPPYKFRAALEYVADGHYQQESFSQYLQRADPPLAFEAEGLNEEEFFLPPPHALNRSLFPADRPLVVFFEQGNCHACDVLHSSPLHSEEIRQLLERFETVQLDILSNTPVITPRGKRTTSRQWAAELDLFYTPTLMFFDRNGQEIIRVDSVVGFYRLRKVLEFVLSGAYQQGITLQQFRRAREGERP